MKKMTLMVSLFALTLAGSAFADQHRYRCEWKSGDDSDAVYVRIERDTLSVSGYDGEATRDDSYRPRRGNEDMYMYTGLSDTEGYQVEVLVEKNMVRGQNEGTMRIRARGEGFFNTTYDCTRYNTRR